MALRSRDAVFLLLLALLNLSSAAARYSRMLGQCSPAAYLQGEPHGCNTEHESKCCMSGRSYPRYSCSPAVTGHQTTATMTVNSFAGGGDGGGPSECDQKYHGDDEMVVALSTGWYEGGSRCSKNIRIEANGRSVLARVVDECDSMNGCDSLHGFQPPCANDVVDVLPAVWEALGMNGDDVGKYAITWSDA
ncbi:Putative ripening-related protein 2 [Apostasia shenzhenica]|uniref:Ripening-related protein 2 n=1 Tax=Apostasia shenzhenica TaxID=1088818 RepID=A0A2I0AC24_9ASPA|nr:Putative ripening-related protein 2 [Apostasia shenzhenica]